ncbi:MAG TPA: NifU family protein [Tissierellia bacterium]|nr:NifU family protein [Tissierellia bacterium]
MLAEIIKVLEEVIKPQLRLHGGDIEILEFDEEKRQLRLRLLGQCCTCPSSISTIDNLIKLNLKDRVKGLEDITVETGLSEEMISLAKELLKIK